MSVAVRDPVNRTAAMAHIDTGRVVGSGYSATRTEDLLTNRGASAWDLGKLRTLRGQLIEKLRGGGPFGFGERRVDVSALQWHVTLGAIWIAHGDAEHETAHDRRMAALRHALCFAIGDVFGVHPAGAGRTAEFDVGANTIDGYTDEVRELAVLPPGRGHTGRSAHPDMHSQDRTRLLDYP